MHTHDHHDHDHGDLPYDVHDKTAVLTAKAITMVVLCSVSICMGLVPLQLARWCKWNSTNSINNPRSMLVVHLLLGFGGGVLLSTTFLHLLPEVAEGVNSLIEEGTWSSQRFAIAEALCCIGFFIMFLVEEIVHTRLRRKEKEVSILESAINNKSRSTNDLIENGSITTIPCDVHMGYNHSHSINYNHSHSHNHNHTANPHGHSHLPIENGNLEINSLRGLLIVLGLSVHELFEGLAIGLESSADYVWYMFAAVAAHKFVIAFCIGVELIANKTKTSLCVIYVCMFAVVSPLGIGIGMILVGGNSAAASGPLAVILQGLASGTLLYVVFFEILQRHRDGLKQFLAIFIGSLVMFGLQVITAHSHDHGAHSHGAHHETEDSHHDASHSHQATTSSAIDAITTGVTTVVDYVTSTTVST